MSIDGHHIHLRSHNQENTNNIEIMNHLLYIEHSIITSLPPMKIQISIKPNKQEKKENL